MEGNRELETNSFGETGQSVIELDTEIQPVKQPRTRKGKNGRNTSTSRTQEGGTNSAESIGVVGIVEEVVKKKRTSKKESDDTVITQNIDLMLTTISGIISVRMGEHWLMSDEESKAIAEPTTRILKRLGVNEHASKYMDYFALIAGLGMYTVPRILVQKELMKNVKKTEVSKPDEANTQSTPIATDTNSIQATLFEIGQ